MQSNPDYLESNTTGIPDNRTLNDLKVKLKNILTNFN